MVSMDKARVGPEEGIGVRYFALSLQNTTVLCAEQIRFGWPAPEVLVGHMTGPQVRKGHVLLEEGSRISLRGKKKP